MTKQSYTTSFVSARPIYFGLLVAVALSYSIESRANSIGLPPVYVRPVETYPALDTRRLYALGMIETGNNDRVIGSAGEVSRYQLSPYVWHGYSKSMDYRNPDVALQVARLHWSYLATYFKDKTGREPDDYDMYVLWNTRHGYYARHGFSKRAIGLVVQDRAQRFVNLIKRKD